MKIEKKVAVLKFTNEEESLSGIVASVIFHAVSGESETQFYYAEENGDKAKHSPKTYK